MSRYFLQQDQEVITNRAIIRNVVMKGIERELEGNITNREIIRNDEKGEETTERANPTNSLKFLVFRLLHSRIRRRFVPDPVFIRYYNPTDTETPWELMVLTLTLTFLSNCRITVTRRSKSF